MSILSMNYNSAIVSHFNNSQSSEETAYVRMTRRDAAMTIGVNSELFATI